MFPPNKQKRIAYKRFFGKCMHFCFMNDNKILKKTRTFTTTDTRQRKKQSARVKIGGILPSCRKN